MDKIFGIARFTVEAGNVNAFRRAAAECMQAVSKDPAGTAAYEWFMAEDGTSCTVIEVYDGAAGIGRHIRQVGKIISRLLEISTSSVILLGDVDQEMQSQVARMNASFFGRRILGRMTEPAAPNGTIGPAGIYVIARFKPKPGTTARFKELAAESFALVAARDPGTEAYEWFANPDETEFLALDIYRSLAAMQAHGGNVGKTMRELMSLADREVELFGAVDQPTQAAFAARGMKFVAPRLQGLL